MVLQRFHRGAGIAAHRTVVLLGDEHHRAGVAELAQLMRMQILIRQPEVVDGSRQGNFSRCFRCRRRGGRAA